MESLYVPQGFMHPSLKNVVFEVSENGDEYLFSTMKVSKTTTWYLEENE